MSKRIWLVLHNKTNELLEIKLLGQSAGAVEYTNYISAEEQNSPIECPRYDTEQSDSEASVMQELWEKAENPFVAIAPRSTLARSGSTWWGPIYGLNRTKLCAYS